MRCATHISVVSYLFLNSLTAVLSFCGSEIRDGSRPPSYPLKNFLYNDTFTDCGCNENNICIRKCCGTNYILNNDTCVLSDEELKVPRLYKNTQLIGVDAIEIRFVPGMLKCIGNGQDEYQQAFPDQDPEATIAMLNDDRLWMSEINLFFDPDEYCLEHTEKYGLTALLCLDRYVDDFNFSDRLSFIGMIISLPFLLVTFIVYALLPERNLHAMSLMCYVAALFMADFLPVFSHIYQGDITFPGCRAIGMMTLFCFMASIFWMNVMSFDICSTFSGSRGYSISGKRKERKRFLSYSIYAWGVPLLFIALIVTLSHTVTPNTWYDPGVRGAECFLRDGFPELLYFYGPLALLITANIIMFVVTACKINKVQKDTAMLTKKGSKKHGAGEVDQQTFKLYIRLLFAMGLNWSVEIINWAVNWQVKNVPPAIWYITDFFNAAYGVVIFFIFVFKKSIWKALKKRYYTVMGQQPPDSSKTGNSSVQL